MKTVILMVGCSGSGKSTKAQEYASEHPGTAVVSADNYFMRDGNYEFVASLLHKAHAFCFEEFMKALASDSVQTVIVDNTNTRHRERETYIKAAKSLGHSTYLWVLDVDEKVAAERNIHAVPLETINRQAHRIDTPIGFYEV